VEPVIKSGLPISATTDPITISIESINPAIEPRPAIPPEAMTPLPISIAPVYDNHNNLALKVTPTDTASAWKAATATTSATASATTWVARILKEIHIIRIVSDIKVIVNFILFINNGAR
jgi:hypothetical protein